jgi:pimeloyl-ACP methyl ester carboxylesterase
MPIAAEIHYNSAKKPNCNGLPVILIHGAGGNLNFWPIHIRRLPGFSIYSIDLPGHGKSYGHGLQDIQAYARSIVDWMVEVKINRAIFVGHSMGGGIALTLAKDFADHVLGLVLVSTGARLRVHPTILENTGNNQTYPTGLNMILGKAFSGSASPLLKSLAAKRMKEIRPSVLHGDLIACNLFDKSRSLPMINVPTLVMCGLDDEMTPLRYSQFLSDNIAGSKLKLIPNAGHMVMLEKPQMVADEISAFLFDSFLSE